jgi:hypothetical protein
VTVRRLATLIVLAIALGGVAACSGAVVFGNPGVECGAFEGPDCNDLLEIGLDAVAEGASGEVVAIAVDDACPPNARCASSELGGATAAFIVRWSDGTIGWATIPLPADWPASPPGEATVMTEAPPPHLLQLVGAVGGG